MEGGGWVAVAAPVPLHQALIYSVPAGSVEAAAPGVRVRVPLGKRSVVGVVVERVATPPEGMAVRSLLEVLDIEPVLPADLRELAKFIADYYLAPIGEVVKAMLPGSLPAWGSVGVWLTDQGALGPVREPVESAIVDWLRDHGRIRLAQLRAAVPGEGFEAALNRLTTAGRVGLSEERRAGSARYQAALELVAGDREAQILAAGRSALARAVIDYLDRAGRPATSEEIETSTGASRAVIKRLADKGIVRRFVQVERLDLGRHEIASRQLENAPIVLRADQDAAVSAALVGLTTRSFQSFLLHGVTGSGKTEVYLRLIAACREAGRAALVLVPEISLVPALAGELRSRFATDLAIFHSALASGERHQEWERVRRGEAGVVLGPRSALFAPVEDLGLIVVDEEQDGAYKQDSVPRYSGRDLAFVRARDAAAVLLVASATPSLESRLNVERGRLRSLSLHGRVGGASLPAGMLVDMRSEERTPRVGEVSFSAPMREALGETFARGEQAILLRNRRGFAPTLLCRACGEDFRCDACGLARTLHKKESGLVCHYCGSRRDVPRSCPSCKRDTLEPIGAGTERVEEEFRSLFPDIGVEVLDRDSAARSGGVAGVLGRFGEGKAQALIGTQMISKGHHFPRVALAGVLAADGYLGFPDFRAVERTYALLTQLGGRAGRGDIPGRVIIQTFHPDHYAITAALRHDDAGFAREEMRFRRAFHYPPYTRMILVAGRSRSRTEAEESLGRFAAEVARIGLPADTRVQGPGPAPFERLRGEWRFQWIARSQHGAELRQAVREALRAGGERNLSVDVDPQNLL